MASPPLESAAFFEAKVPAGHAEHAAEPVESLYWPALQATQVSFEKASGNEDEVPAGQELQEQLS